MHRKPLKLPTSTDCRLLEYPGQMELELWHKNYPFTSVIPLPWILKFLSLDAYAAFHSLHILREKQVLQRGTASHPDTRACPKQHQLPSWSGFVFCWDALPYLGTQGLQLAGWHANQLHTFLVVWDGAGQVGNLCQRWEKTKYNC